MLPTFIVIGAQKCATTSLWEMLRQHPSFFLSSLKEPNFFLTEGTWDRGRSWYEHLFDDAGQATHVGEVSPGYTMFPTFSGVPERMASLVPDAKLVYIVRDPVERMRSSYAQARADGHETRPIGDALIRDTRYVTLSMYALQLQQYLAVYERGQILVLAAEELRHDVGATLDRLLAFLGAEIGWRPPTPVAANPSSSKRTVTRPGRLVKGWLDHRPIRHHPQVKSAKGRWPLSRPFRPGETALDDDLRGILAAWVRPDTQRFVDMAEDDATAWSELWPTLA